MLKMPKLIRSSINQLVSIGFILAFAGTAFAETAKWHKSVNIDDFDDSKTFASSIVASKQGALTVRYHEDNSSDYEVFWSFPDSIFMTCGDTGSWLDHSGYGNIEIRIDNGEVMSLTGTPSTDKKAAFLADGSEHSVEELVKSLKGSKKVVIRTKDKCHEKGQSWIFSKFTEILGANYLDEIAF